MCGYGSRSHHSDLDLGLHLTQSRVAPAPRPALGRVGGAEGRGGLLDGGVRERVVDRRLVAEGSWTGEGVTGGYRGLQGVTGDTGFTRSYKRSPGCYKGSPVTYREAEDIAEPSPRGRCPATRSSSSAAAAATVIRPTPRPR